MRLLLPTLSLALLALFVPGCAPAAKTPSEQEISRGDAKLAELDEQRKVEDVTGNDFDKMTQVDPDLLQEAMAAFDKAIEDDPNDAEAYYARGFARLSHSNAMLKAIEDFTKAIELNPKYARAYLMRGRAYEALGDMDKANADRASALELEPGID